jgi:hypothetical protein
MAVIHSASFATLDEDPNGSGEVRTRHGKLPGFAQLIHRSRKNPVLAVGRSQKLTYCKRGWTGAGIPALQKFE